MTTASCSQARSFSPTQAAIIAKYLIMAEPSIASFSTGRSSTARCPSRRGIVLSPEPGIDQAKDAQCRAEIWLSLDDFLLLRAGSTERRSRFGIALDHTSDDAFHE